MPSSSGQALTKVYARKATGLWVNTYDSGASSNGMIDFCLNIIAP